MAQGLRSPMRDRVQQVPEQLLMCSGIFSRCCMYVYHKEQ